MLTLNQIVRRIKTIALNQAQLRHFYFGSLPDFETDKTIKFASLFLQDQPGIIDVDGKMISYLFKAFFLDLEDVSFQTQNNTLDVQSDMMQCATDMLALFNFSDYHDWKISGISNFILVREELDDILAGVAVDFTISVPYDKDVCAVPSNSISETTTLFWSYFETDPYSDIQNKDFLFSKEINKGVLGYSLNFESFGYNYLAIKESSDELEKTKWINTALNYGTFPDSVFRDPIIIGNFRYYVSRIPVVIDSTNLIFTFNV